MGQRQGKVRWWEGSKARFHFRSRRKHSFLRPYARTQRGKSVYWEWEAATPFLILVSFFLPLFRDRRGFLAEISWISIIFTAERSTASSSPSRKRACILHSRDASEKHGDATYTRDETARRGITKRGRDKKIKRETGAHGRKERKGEREGERQRRTTRNDTARCIRQRSAATPARCVSVCRAGGRPRSMASRSSGTDGARPCSALGQWWSHWPPRASRQWHRARRCCHRTPGVSPLPFLLYHPYRERNDPTTAAPLPSLRSTPTLFRSPLESPQPRRHPRIPALVKEKERDGEPRQCRRYQHRAPLTVVPRAKLGACTRSPAKAFTSSRNARPGPVSRIFFPERSWPCCNCDI